MAAAMVNMNNLLNGKDSRWLQLEVCREFQRNKCSRPDTECKFAHPPANVEVQNGRVTACYDSIKGRCNREKPPCKYFHPPQHLKDQLLINGRNHLALKNALMQQMGIAPGQPVLPGQVPAVATNPYITGLPASSYNPFYPPGALVPTILGPDPSSVGSPLGPVVQQAMPVAQQKIPRSDRLEVCREFLRGACKRAESECRFAHPQESVTTHDDGTVTVCMDAVKGRCARDPCRYFHPPLHLQAQIKAAQSRVTAPKSTVGTGGNHNSAAAAAVAAHMSLLTQSQMGQGGGQPMSIHPAILAAQQSAQQAAAAVAAATAAAAASSHGSNVSAVGALNHHPSIEVGKKRTAENDVFPLMDMKTVGSYYYDSLPFANMVPFKRPAADKSGIPVYQPSATTYQQLMQLHQPYIPVSCEYLNTNLTSSTIAATSATVNPQTTSSFIATSLANSNNLNNNINNIQNNNSIYVNNSNTSILNNNHTSIINNNSNSNSSAVSSISSKPLILNLSASSTPTPPAVVSSPTTVSVLLPSSSSVSPITCPLSLTTSTPSQSQSSTSSPLSSSLVLNSSTSTIANNNTTLLLPTSSSQSTTTTINSIASASQSISNNNIITNTLTPNTTSTSLSLYATTIDAKPLTSVASNDTAINSTTILSSTNDVTLNDTTTIATATSLPLAVVVTTTAPPSVAIQHTAASYNSTVYSTPSHTTNSIYQQLNHNHTAASLNTQYSQAVAAQAAAAALYTSQSNLYHSVAASHQAANYHGLNAANGGGGMATLHQSALSNYNDRAALAKEMAQKNYALKVAAANANTLSGKPLTAYNYTGVALNKANNVVPLAAYNQAAVARQMQQAAAVASQQHQQQQQHQHQQSAHQNQQANPYMQNPFQRPPHFLMQSPLLRPQLSMAAAAAAAASPALAHQHQQNPYAAAAAAAGQQLFNQNQFFYPGLTAATAGYQLGAGMPQMPGSVQANMAGLQQMAQVQSVQPAAPGNSSVVLNPYKKMKTS